MISKPTHALRPSHERLQGPSTPVAVAFVAVDGGKEWAAHHRDDAKALQATLLALMRKLLMQVGCARAQHAVHVAATCGACGSGRNMRCMWKWPKDHACAHVRERSRRRRRRERVCGEHVCGERREWVHGWAGQQLDNG
eukprot:356827-Chlamydomonas_euryale.AAC.5